MHIAVVGAGIAGLASAWQFALAGHQVDLFEQTPKCAPVGAGILLQPSGQAVLQRWGVLDQIQSSSPRIDALHAVHRNGSTLVHLRYKRINDGLYGLGVLRNTLFDLLYRRCESSGVKIHEGCTISHYDQDAQAVRIGGNVNDADTVNRSFDLLVAADGSRSRLRASSGLEGRVIQYPDAAIWTVGPWTGKRDVLRQIVGRSGRLMGILPVGHDQCSFFWGLPTHERDETLGGTVDDWRKRVLDFYPDAEQTISQVRSMQDITYSTYRNAVMRRWVDRRVVFIGDAAHATSPHLGQGLNLALEDANVLTQSIANLTDVP
ncbi:MAG: NAD(P)/FAD-dependent oxidoreductase, partial [Planctomycetota bacterium]